MVHLAGPRDVLDAGAGLLRNYPLFPGSYTTIGIDAEELRHGIESNSALITPDRIPKVYELDMNEEFGFLGPFDYCVCTATLDYMTDPFFSIGCMEAMLRKRGHLFFTLGDKAKGLALAERLALSFEWVFVVYYGSTDTPQDLSSVAAEVLKIPLGQTFDLGQISNRQQGDLNDLTQREMAASADQDRNSSICVIAQGKMSCHALRSPPFKLKADNGVFVKA